MINNIFTSWVYCDEYGELYLAQHVIGEWYYQCRNSGQGYWYCTLVSHAKRGMKRIGKL